jgi:hypothetical protein
VTKPGAVKDEAAKPVSKKEAKKAAKKSGARGEKSHQEKK